jgi:DEAD/DEAH box helicase domain-containing protein
MSVSATPVLKLLRAWRAEPTVASNIAAWRDLPPRPPKWVPFPDSLHPELARALARLGITALYTHQAEAWRLAQSGRNVMIVTGTASGKTLAYNLPILDRLMQNSEGRALYIFPTKALAHDQASALQSLLANLPTRDAIPLGIYDGDTPSRVRPGLRSRARLVYTNPDMLHIGILPYHTAWSDFFSRLEFIVLDETHIYRGVFGSHVANVIRRLMRVARFYGSEPRFILTSATLANPKEFGQRLLEADVSLVDEDGAANGPKKFLIYNPPIVNPELGLRLSALQESVRLSEDLLAYSIQTIIFGRSRRTVELILTYLRQRALPLSPSTAEPTPTAEQAVRGYRSGYLPGQRRQIERGLRDGKVRAVVATNALELGIDIGGIGAAILVGYPGSIAATWQQAGRAGRQDTTALAVLVATSDPLDQFLAAHPDYFFERSPEHALINPDNLLILLAHLRCAAFELPFQSGENFGGTSPEKLGEFLEFLQKQGVLHRSGSKYFWMADQYPAQQISLRSASTTTVLLQSMENDIPVTIGQIDQASAYWMTHPQAVYIHEAQTYVVEELDLEQNVAHLQRAETDYYTAPRSETTVQILEEYARAEAAGANKAHGEILVTSQVIGFRKLRWFTHETLGVEQLSMPSTELLTTGYWLALNDETLESLRSQGLWNNDPNNYGSNWNVQRQRARQRDGYRCQVCGAPEQDRAHDVHHKAPFRSFPSYEQANQLENLITLCPACHRRAETAVRVRSGLSGLAYVLSHLAPFFLMCDVGDLGVHSDPQAPFADGAPAVVIYDQVPAGIGFSQRLFELHAELIVRARELVASCACQDGCPSCVGPGGEAGQGSKRETLAILEALSNHI